MTKLLLATTAAVALATTTAASAGTFAKVDLNGDLAFECSMVKVIPVEKSDRDPIYKINLMVDGQGFSGVVHTSVAGKEWDRTDQYSNLKTWRNESLWGWTGWSAKYQVSMKGVLTYDKGRVT